MTLLSLSGTGLFITVPWLLFDVINILNGATMAKYDSKRLVSKYNNVLEEPFLKTIFLSLIINIQIKQESMRNLLFYHYDEHAC